jgi:DNA repair and recombination protein RAD54B
MAAVDNLALPGPQPAVFRYFTCVWGKKSNRKHKKWEGDAVLRVGPTSVVLVDEEGKELGRGSGYKAEQLQELGDGGQLGVGGKEVEVTGEYPTEGWERLVGGAKRKAGAAKAEAQAGRSAAPKQQPAPIPSPTSLPIANPNFKPFRVRARLGATLPLYTAAQAVAPGRPMFDPRREGALVLPGPPPGHALRAEDHRLVEVVVDPFVGRHLRHHQRLGLIFLYPRVLGFTQVRVGEREVPVEGAILADEMGLGKTLQTVALVWTLLKQSPVAGQQLAKKVLIVAPSSLLRNWEKEFRKWLGSERITVHVAETGDKVMQFRSYSSAPVLLVSYEMMVRTLPDLAKVPWDLIVCDEAHRLKNSTIKASAGLAELPCRRRVLLTGTPVQNDLGELYSLVEAVGRPCLLGPRHQFTREVEGPVAAGRQPGASAEETAAAARAMLGLDLATRQIVLRRTKEVINRFLPPRTVNVVFCRAVSGQAAVYRREVARLLEADQGQHLAAIARLRKVCNGPSLLEGPQEPAASWEEQAGKLAALACLLVEMVATTDERMVLVSLSTSTLDLLATLCARHSVPCTRLDGSTPPAARQPMVDRFNSPGSQHRVFLLSSKAGGAGLNLIGASRLVSLVLLPIALPGPQVLYDLDWNPAVDQQAMGRVHRDGQTRPCHIYRLITAGTIEEKMYQRQVGDGGGQQP